ncbi:TIGR04066 family peptide maturation system protein [Paenibacillus sp. FSL H8-0122]|uniref:TIGR04066 family peptide maturation system protein n=1 Tax=Paenibacillus sp. FSL H8-0122 TaxID=2954510 RepID=UPI0030F8219B
MKKRLAIFPFVEDIMPLLDHKDKIQDYELRHVILPMGWETSDNVDNPHQQCFCNEELFYSENLIHSIDVLLLCRPLVQVDKSLYSRIITIAEQNDKTIIYVPELMALLSNHSMDSWISLGPERTVKLNNKTILNVDVPVIMILGMGENCGKLNTQLDLCDFFHQKGYRASLISSNPLTQLLGYHTLPSTLDSPELTFSEQVGTVNAYVKCIESIEHPDVMILAVPGGIFKYSESIPNGYGYLPYLISNAVKPDITILSLYCGNYEETHLNEIQNTCLYRYGAKANYFHISQKVCEYSFETGLLNYFSVDLSYLTEEIIKPQEHYNFFNTLDNNSRDRIFEKIMFELQTNVASI